MPRKKTTPSNAPSVESPTVDSRESVTAVTTATTTEPDVDPSTASKDGTGKNYGPPYKAIFTSSDKGFELGENRRYKQRVFTFKDKPDEQTIAALKENGFTYRPAEKAWTTEATAESRVLTDRLARQFAGNESSMGRG